MSGRRRAARPLLVVARSARALAQAARAAGYAPYVIDLFGDSDTRASAVRYRRCAAREGYDFNAEALVAAVAALAGRDRPPLVWGGGLEGRAALLAACAHHCELLGTAPEALPAIVSPLQRAECLRQLGIATPELAFGRVPARGGWLCKRIGEAGGWHVRPALPGERLDAACYAQRRVQGRALSVSFLAAARRVQVLGYSAQLFAPSSARPYAWAGAIGGIALPRKLRRAIAAALPALAEAFALRGLCGIDFVLDADGRWWLVDLNPRPTATLELLVSPAAALRAHLAACRDREWPAPAPRKRPWALAVPWSDDPIRLPKSLDWPAWVADRPGAGARLPRDAPLCSVRASGPTAEAALRALHRRLRDLGERLGGAVLPLPDCRPPANDNQPRALPASTSRDPR
ncbi:MAG TPA: ATP-grasp domain-containing protein [Gammaproteobacteria bacterium]|nr:ATP-grasp domain-containing protein [Gammaproteobacteria bacterium]